MTSEIGAVLAWDSEFFGFGIGRVTARQLTPHSGPALREWIRERGLLCVTFLVDAEDGESIRAAEELGFRHMDVRVTRERALPPGSVEGSALDRARPDEVPALLEIARKSHHMTRFYRDPRFPKERCDELYARWVQRGLEDADQDVLVVRRADGPAGYVVCAGRGSERGRIGLIAVAPGSRAEGLGTRLVRGALAWMISHGCTRGEVVGQGHNVAASRLYERQGFLTLRVEHWFHLWPDVGGR